MAIAKCFRCKEDYESSNPDDIVGDGRCKSCKDLGQRVALKVDIDMANKRMNETRAKSRLEEMGISHEGHQLDLSGRIIKAAPPVHIGMRDLGITPNG